MRMHKLSRGGLKVLVQGLCRALAYIKFVSESPCTAACASIASTIAGVRSVGLEALL